MIQRVEVEISFKARGTRFQGSRTDSNSGIYRRSKLTAPQAEYINP